MKYLIVYYNSPDAPSTPAAIFPENMLKEAIDFTNQAYGYYTIKIADWNGIGKIPEYNESKLY